MHVSVESGSKNKELEKWAEKNKHLFDGDKSVNYVSPTQVPQYIQHVKDKPTVSVSQSGGGSGGGGGGGYDPMAEYREFYAQQQAELARREAERKAALQKQYDVALEQAGQSKDMGLTDSYLSYMKGIKNQKQMAAITGGGGEIESLKNRSQLGYEENRAGINRDYANNAKQLLAQLQSDQMATSDAFSEKMSSAGNNFYQNLMAKQSMYAKAANASGGGAKTTKTINYKGKNYSLDDWVREQRLLGKSDEQIYKEADRNGLMI